MYNRRRHYQRPEPVKPFPWRDDMGEGACCPIDLRDKHTTVLSGPYDAQHGCSLVAAVRGTDGELYVMTAHFLGWQYAPAVRIAGL